MKIRFKWIYLFCAILMSLLLGCIQFSKNNDLSQVTSAGRFVDRAPAEFNFEAAIEQNLATFVEDPIDPMILRFTDGHVIDCNKILTRNEIFNGKSYLRFNISDPDQLGCPQVKAMKTPRPWIVKKTIWAAGDELGFQKFVTAIGKTVVGKTNDGKDLYCNTADKCLSGTANTLRSEEDMLNVFYTDCADLPYYLRAYYAYKNNLPMSFVLEIARNDFTPEQQKRYEQEIKKYQDNNDQDGLDKYLKTMNDLRYSQNGNRPISRLNIPNSSGVARDFGQVAPTIVNVISSGFLRMTSAPDNSFVQPDFYSPVVSPSVIIPGTILYQPAGHVAVVYDVNPENGTISFIDSHPDNSLSRGKFNLDYKVLNMKYGGNFKNFRPYILQNITKDSKGQITKATPLFISDYEIAQFSLEQYNGDSPKVDGNPVFKLNPSDAKGARFHDWVKYRLSKGKYRLNPIDEMKTEVESLCLAAQDRIIAVNDAVNNEIHQMPHPLTLPRNIYGAEGAWESYSSPGRDIRFRDKILSIPIAAKDWITRFKDKDLIINYSGSNLKADLIATYKKSASDCSVNYTNSAGQSTVVSLEKIIDRASNISFDPYMCPEIRWGANSADELLSCRDDQNKKEWHKYTQFLRNALEKDTKAIHGQSLNKLKELDAGKLVNNANTDSNFNILNKLNAL